MIVNQHSPFYVKVAYQFIVIFFICYFIAIAKGILIPLAFAMLLAVLLLPVAEFMELRGLGKATSAGIAIFLAVAFLGGIIYFLSSQVASFIRDIPSIREHLNGHIDSLRSWIYHTFGVSFEEQNQYLNEQAAKLRESGTWVIRNTVFSLTEIVLLCILIPVYIFLLLYYRKHIRNFLFIVFKSAYREEVKKVMDESKVMIRRYITGLLIEMVIVATANSIGLLILGIQYAIFFGVLSAVLNLIPYIGMLTATFFTILVTLSTSGSSSDLVWIIIIFYGIHIIDVNFMMPKIVSSRLRINALISILGVIAGGALAGIPGLFLSVPAVAFIKIICDHVDDLKPWGMLMGGDTEPAPPPLLYRKLRRLPGITGKKKE